MRDTRYVLTRRKTQHSRRPERFFERSHTRDFESLDLYVRAMDRPLPRLFGWRFALGLVAWGVFVFALCSALLSWGERRPPPAPARTSYELARDDAARERAAQFVRTLGFEPGPAACRSKRDGSAWCTIRVAGSDKTFALWCSDEHPMCIENLARE